MELYKRLQHVTEAFVALESPDGKQDRISRTQRRQGLSDHLYRVLWRHFRDLVQIDAVSQQHDPPRGHAEIAWDLIDQHLVRCHHAIR